MNEAQSWMNKAQQRPMHADGEVRGKITDEGHCHIRVLTDGYGASGDVVMSGMSACDLARWILQTYGKV